MSQLKNLTCNELSLLGEITYAVQEYCKENDLTKAEAQLLITMASTKANEAMTEAYWNHVKYRELVGRTD